ncbi:hypothetical protein GCM10011575_13780 [Microlunatus endophyticus]|uniref:Uncharacterized protein n=1 Tax=Microlunatus endophyticus TaxID=1716077 RepID=A0A917W2U6_9ACTN|nr:hypothetical protein [Microlunatus endophyticus]GGL56564.1 hypothetical protein GCM10011575_13780 [Microlunatus endophyticus]
MATLMLDETRVDCTRSTRADLVSRPRPAVALSDARGSVIVLRQAQDTVLGRGQIFDRIPGENYALADLCGPSNGHSQPEVRLDAVINQSKSIKSIDEGLSAAKHDGMGAFVTSLGSRPPSPPA